MKPVKNIVPNYQIQHPVGSKIRWVSPAKVADVYTIRGYNQCHMNMNRRCFECDGSGYLVEEDSVARCHYRGPESKFGLCYWERTDNAE